MSGRLSTTMCAAALSLALGACGGLQSAGGDGGGDAQQPGSMAWAGKAMEAATANAGGAMVDAQVVDEAGFGQPMVASRLQIPAGWQTSGGIRWNDGAECYVGQVVSTWAAAAPDGSSVFQTIPGVAWQVSGTEIPTDPCPVAPYRSARELLEAVAQQIRPGARVLDFSDWPEMTQKAEARAQDPAGGMPPGFRRWIESGRLLIAYQAGGVEMREILAATVTFLQGNKLDGSTGRIVSYRAPNGQLDFGLLDRIVGSADDDPQWTQLARERIRANVERYYSAQRQGIEAWHNRRMAEINARGAADRHAINMGALRDVAAIRNSTWADTQAANDRMHARTIDAIHERSAYAGVDGSTVYSSIHGGSRVFQDNVWTDRSYSTDDAFHNPTDATELERRW